VKVEYMDPFVEAARAVLEEVCGGRAKPGALGLLGTTFATASINIAARIDGTLVGEVVYSMSSRTAQKLAGLLVKAETHGFGRLTGTGLAELGCMLAKESARLLAEQGHDCRFSSPIVFRGLNVEFSVIAPALTVPIDSDAGQVEVKVAVRNGK
jgi:chemotaxis protein CheX